MGMLQGHRWLGSLTVRYERRGVQEDPAGVVLVVLFVVRGTVVVDEPGSTDFGTSRGRRVVHGLLRTLVVFSRARK